MESSEEAKEVPKVKVEECDQEIQQTASVEVAPTASIVCKEDPDVTPAVVESIKEEEGTETSTKSVGDKAAMANKEDNPQTTSNVPVQAAPAATTMPTPKKKRLDPDTWNPPDIPNLDTGKSASKRAATSVSEVTAKQPRISKEVDSTVKDTYCWVCHKEKAQVSCDSCCRSFHGKCLPVGPESEIAHVPANKRASVITSLKCIPCLTKEKRKEKPLSAFRAVSRPDLNILFKIVVEKIKTTCDGSFHHPVDPKVDPDYVKKIAHPVSLQDIDERASANEYVSLEDFLADFEWIAHNSAICHGGNSPLTRNALQTLKSIQAHLSEMETCPDCYRFHHSLPDNVWYTEVCSRPHTLVMARIAGYPIWPAKLTLVDDLSKQFHVRFFGPGHEVGIVKKDACFLLMAKNCFEEGKSANKKSKLGVSLQELRDYIAKFETKFKVNYPYAANPRTPVVSRFVSVPGTSAADDSGEVDYDFNEVHFEMDLDRESTQKTPKTPSSTISTPISSKMDVQDEVSTNSKKDKSFVAATSSVSQTTPIQQRTKTAQSLKKKLQASTGSSKKPASPTIAQSPESAATQVVTPVRPLTPVELPDVAVTTEKALEEMTDQELKDEVVRLRKVLNETKEKYQKATTDREEKWTQLMEEQKKTFELAKKTEMNKLRANLKKELEEKLEKTKKMQWCAFCSQQASYYCCWNTSYCSQDCQHKDWAKHMMVCQQGRQEEHPKDFAGQMQQGNGVIFV